MLKGTGQEIMLPRSCSTCTGQKASSWLFLAFDGLAATASSTYVRFVLQGQSKQGR